MSDTQPFTANEMEDRLEEFVDAVLSSGHTAASPAKDIAHFERQQQEFVLHWVATISKTNFEMAYRFAAYASRAMRYTPDYAVRWKPDDHTGYRGEYVLKTRDRLYSKHGCLAFIRSV